MAKLSVRDLDLCGKRVFLRVDFNVPIEAGRVTDASRIDASLPTIRYLIERRARVIVASHLGRPKGQRDSRYSLRPVADVLTERLGPIVTFALDCVGPEVEALASSLAEGHVLLLENLRFHPGEEKNDPEFARSLARLADLYVNDAFGTAHRAHASTVGITSFVPVAAAGLLMERELDYLGRALTHPEHPFVVLLGGAKVSDKIPVLTNLLNHADAILIGGAMAYTFLVARGGDVGASRVETDYVSTARDLLVRAEARQVPLVLPVDHVVVDSTDPTAPPRVVSGDAFPPSAIGMDIGPTTIELFGQRIRQARTVIWNGPVGVFERPPFDQGTVALAHEVASVEGVTIVGGGDSVAAIHRAGVADRITHLSTGGGATLEFLAGVDLPGVAALTEKT
ncbi:MAG TPA: phosphoglycerate kinase [Blastocatellia bacterium]|nr:phosphoglycerate kinase [Blastocatellia bacterium]